MLNPSKNPGSSVEVVVSTMFVTDVDANVVVVVSRADAIVEEADGIKAARVGDVLSRAVLIVVVTSEATEEAIEPKVRVSNRKAMAHCDFHR